MPNLLAMSFEGELAPSFDLRCLEPGKTPPDGWGIGYYPGGEPYAVVLKEPAPPQGSIRSELVREWEHLESGLFVLHIRRAKWGALSDANTQPFEHTWGRRNWLFAHGGSLRERLAPSPDSLFEPVGSTDTELVFCELLNRLEMRRWRSLGDANLEVVHSWMLDLNKHGGLSTVLTDGRDLLCYADQGTDPLYVWELLPPHNRIVFGDADLDVDLSRRGIKSRKGIVVSTDRLVGRGDSTPVWRALNPGSMIAVRQGAIRAELLPPEAEGKDDEPKSSRSLIRKSAPIKLPESTRPMRYEITHKTVYRYTTPVERSSHLLRLVPMHDRTQRLLESNIAISVDGQARDYDDVFGNRVRRLVLETPFTELAIEAKSKVEVLDIDPLSYRPLHARSSIPLVWMPWQRHMLDPYLLPPELPESQLAELAQYAMSFVERNDYDLLDTLLDLNQSIFREYEYKQGSTTNATTPFDVYVNRRGVCQDFTNVFICLARLLGVPARYTCGYVYTRSNLSTAAAARMGEASHAWVQVYLPEVGWKGFDPTNGSVTQTEHVRVAVGRNYVDATPTSGTLYVGGGPETLSVDVRMDPF